MKSAGPSDAVEILGLSGVPQAGDVLVAVSDERKARQIATMRSDREKARGKASTRITLESLQKQIQTGEVKELRLIIKADVQGSVEALAESLERLSTEEVKLKVIHSSAGAINESDVMLASASNAIVLGFNVKTEPKAASQAQANGVDVRDYNVIYEAINDVKAALEGLLAPEIRETILGRAHGQADLRHLQAGPDRRLDGDGGQDDPRRPGPRQARDHRARPGSDHLAPPVQGRRPRGAHRAGLRYRRGERQRSAARRHHRGVHERGSRAHAVARQAAEANVSAARVALGMVELHLPDVDSLKGKRHVLKGLKEKVRARFECSVAEVDHQDTWQRATLAIAYVSADSRHANEVVSKALDFIENTVEGEVLETFVEIL